MSKKENVVSNDTPTKTVLVEKHKKEIIIALGVIVVLLLGVFAYRYFVSTPREDKASTMLGKGAAYFNSQQYERALNGDSTGYIGFVKLADKYSGTDAGNLAKLYAGLSYAQLDKWADALNYLKKYDAGSDAMVSPAAQAALGDAYAHQKDIDKAISCYKKAASMADKKAPEGISNSLAPTFLLKAGILLESQGKTADALKMYQDIKKKYVNSMVVGSSEIDKYIERAQAK